MSALDGIDAAAGGHGARIRFSPTIELGHLVQALVILASVGGWAIVGYYTIEKQIDVQNADMMLVKQRMTVIEAAHGDLRDSQRVSAIETRQALTKISDQLADLRTLVAAQGKGPADATHR